MTIGEKLRQARLNRKLTTSQVASATRMMVQIVDDLEQEDFTRMAAPIYAKGFIRMYAEEVGLDPKPLIEEYMESIQGTKPAFIMDDNDSSEALGIGSREFGHTDDVEEEKEEEEEDVEKKPSLLDKITKVIDKSFTSPSKKREQIIEQGETEIIEDHAPKQTKMFDVADEDDPDLFSRIERGNIDLGTTHEAPAPKTNQRIVAFSIYEINKKAIDFVVDIYHKVKEKLTPAIDRIPKPKIRMPNISFSGSPIMSASIILGVLIILILIISSMHSCSKRPEKKIVVPATEEEVKQVLQLAVEPSDPYFN